MEQQQQDTKKKGKFSGKSRKPGKGEAEFDQKMVDIRRVARVVKGGKRFKFRSLVVIGDKNGKVGIGLAKGADVSSSMAKSVAKAKKSLIDIDINKPTIPHEVFVKYKSARILIKPAKEGSGIIAGSALREICLLSGLKNVSIKLMGSRNRVNNCVAMIAALKKLYKGYTIAPVKHEDRMNDRDDRRSYPKRVFNKEKAPIKKEKVSDNSK